MKTEKRSFASITTLELAAGAVSLILCAVSLTATAQTPRNAPPSTPTTAIPANGKPLEAVQPSRVLANPDTRIYSRCTTGHEHDPPAQGEAPYKPNPKAQVMTEEEAKAKGFKEGAHKVACP